MIVAACPKVVGVFFSSRERNTKKARHQAGLFLAFASQARVPGRRALLGRRHFFGFAFLAHEFQFALGFLVRGLHLLLDPLRRLFELR